MAHFDKDLIAGVIIQHPDSSQLVISRCIDGRYDAMPNLPALALPGGDAGQLAALYAAANVYGFELDHAKAFHILQEMVGKQEFSLHTDADGDKQVTAEGCGHLKSLRTNPEKYHLSTKDITTLDNQLKQAVADGAVVVRLHDHHHERAIMMVEGEVGILPECKITTDSGPVYLQLFIFHRGLVHIRHIEFAKKLIETEAVKLYPGLDTEYLVEILDEVIEEHFFETVTALAQGLPIYGIEIKGNKIKAEDLGIVGQI